MNDDRWQRVADVYQAAQERPPEERLAFVRQASDSDSGLRREVESLLAQDEKTVVLDRPIAAAAHSLLADNAAVQPGSFIGPYRIDSLLGVGGMGEVYRATDTRLHRAVAIKVLAPSLAHNPQFRARFDREAKAIAALNHPHICTLFDIGASDGIDFLVMEYVEGETLSARLERGALPFEHALTTAIEISDALAAAHERG